MRGTRQLVAVTAALAAAPMLAGCGGAGPSAADSSSGSTTATSTPSAPSGTPTPSGSPASNPLSRSNPAHLELVRADQLATKGKCRAAPKRGLVCASGGASLRFNPGAVQRIGVVKVEATPSQQSSGWKIDLAFAPAGTRAFAKLTRTAARTHESAILMLPGSRRVLVAAQVQSAITDGDVQITGGYTKASASRIVRLVTATAG